MGLSCGIGALACSSKACKCTNPLPCGRICWAMRLWGLMVVWMALRSGRLGIYQPGGAGPYPSATGTSRLGQFEGSHAVRSLSNTAFGAAPRKSEACAEEAVLPMVEAGRREGLAPRSIKGASAHGHGWLCPPQSLPAKEVGPGPGPILLPSRTPQKCFYNEIRPEPSEPKGIKDVVCAHMLASWGNFNE